MQITDIKVRKFFDEGPMKAIASVTFDDCLAVHHPDKCEVAFKYYQAFADSETINQVECECKAGARGCADCKRQLGAIINEKFAPIRAKRQEYASDMDKVKDIINEGNRKAQAEAEKVLAKVRDAVNI